MRLISLDDVGQVMPAGYWEPLKRTDSSVYTAMVIQAPNGRKLAITFPTFSPHRKVKDISNKQRQVIRMFMKETRNGGS